MGRIHMGETLLPEKGKDHITKLLDEADTYYRSSKPLRIGHGTHISFDDMQRVVDKGYYVESCLSSNKKTGIIGKRSEYPLGLMLLLGVKVVIGTDGGPLYSTSLGAEYAYAVRSLDKFCRLLSDSEDFIALQNGDPLRFRHVSHLLREKTPIMAADAPLTYRQLNESLKDDIKKRISPDQLVKNAQDLFNECYSGLN